MWRALFLAIGVCLMLVGIQCLGVSQFTLKLREEAPQATSIWEASPTVGPQKKLTPPPWVPWSLMSTGAVVCLYSFTLPKRVNGG